MLKWMKEVADVQGVFFSDYDMFENLFQSQVYNSINILPNPLTTHIEK